MTDERAAFQTVIDDGDMRYFRKSLVVLDRFTRSMGCRFLKICRRVLLSKQRTEERATYLVPHVQWHVIHALELPAIPSKLLGRSLSVWLGFGRNFSFSASLFFLRRKLVRARNFREKVIVGHILQLLYLRQSTAHCW